MDSLTVLIKRWYLPRMIPSYQVVIKGGKKTTKHQQNISMWYHRALDKLAEILKLYLKHTYIKQGLKSERLEDVKVLHVLDYIKNNSSHYARKLGYVNGEKLREVCQKLTMARNSCSPKVHKRRSHSPNSRPRSTGEKYSEG